MIPFKVCTTIITMTSEVVTLAAKVVFCQSLTNFFIHLLFYIDSQFQTSIMLMFKLIIKYTPDNKDSKAPLPLKYYYIYNDLRRSARSARYNVIYDTGLRKPLLQASYNIALENFADLKAYLKKIKMPF